MRGLAIRAGSRSRVVAALLLTLLAGCAVVSQYVLASPHSAAGAVVSRGAHGSARHEFAAREVPSRLRRQAIVIQAVSAARLLDAGIVLSPPQSAATVSQAQAEAAAQHVFPSSVRQAVLASMSDNHRSPPIAGLYWAISMDPSGIPDLLAGPGANGSSAPHPAFLLVFVDAQTGRPLESIAGTSS